MYVLKVRRDIASAIRGDQHTHNLIRFSVPVLLNLVNDHLRRLYNNWTLD